MKKDRINTFVPTTKPIRANNLMSPPPIPPLLTTAIASKRVNPITAARIESHHGVSGTKIRSNKKIPANTINILSGMSIYVISETKMMTNREISVQAINNSDVHPNTSGAETNNNPVANSMIG